MKKENAVGIAAILVGCGVAIGALVAKIHYDKNKEYFDEVKRLKNETDLKLSKEFYKELKEELKKENKQEQKANVSVAVEEAPASEADVKNIPASET